MSRPADVSNKFNKTMLSLRDMIRNVSDQKTFIPAHPFIFM